MSATAAPRTFSAHRWDAPPLPLRCIVCGDVIASPRARVVCSTYCRARNAGAQNRNHHSAETRERLARLWVVVPPISTAEIGRQLRVTKNVVVSLRRRMGLVARPAPFPLGAARKPPSPKSPPHPPARSSRPEQLPPAARLHKDHTPPAAFPVRSCQFPTSDDRPWRFCGDPTVDGGPYCEKCRAICWVVPPRHHALEAAA